MNSMPSSSHLARDWRSSPSSIALFRRTPISTLTCLTRTAFIHRLAVRKPPLPLAVARGKPAQTSVRGPHETPKRATRHNHLRHQRITIAPHPKHANRFHLHALTMRPTLLKMSPQVSRSNSTFKPGSRASTSLVASGLPDRNPPVKANTQHDLMRRILVVRQRAQEDTLALGTAPLIHTATTAEHQSSAPILSPLQPKRRA